MNEQDTLRPCTAISNYVLDNFMKKMSSLSWVVYSGLCIDALSDEPFDIDALSSTIGSSVKSIQKSIDELIALKLVAEIPIGTGKGYAILCAETYHESWNGKGHSDAKG